ncbi:glycosyltransferase family 4 protein [Virgibacillus kekensis]|uniref:Glycosyltransferase family 4 protein n=1 Tax=Virgibacillus kekensis TaxID=202261 RepID=A0ABV9DGP9_9BACI
MNILFLSAQDFKEKSIQVIRKTPEAYVKHNIGVHYVVERDMSKHGNYYYEDEINPKGVKVYRFEVPLAKLRNRFNNGPILALLQKLAKYISIVKLAVSGSKVLKNEQIDICYGYGVNGVLAANLLKLVGKLKGIKLISRFQGTFYFTEMIKEKKILKSLFNWEGFLSLYLPADLCILTNDGTQGDMVLSKIHSKNLRNMKFWPNGVDEQKLPKHEVERLEKIYNPKNKTIVVTVCRLVKVKRVDRGIEAFSKVVNEMNVKNIEYIIIGEGTERGRLEELAKKLNVSQYIKFVGSIKNEQVKEYLNVADIFLSTYDVSNVGNPLLEAIRANKAIITLNNGDTASWIKHNENGYIYDVNENTTQSLALGLARLHEDVAERERIINAIKLTENEKLWTWDERMNTEVGVVKKLADY